MAGQYQTDVIGRPFSGTTGINGAMVVSEVPQKGKRQTKQGKEDTNPEDVHDKLKNRFDDAGYY